MKENFGSRDYSFFPKQKFRTLRHTLQNHVKAQILGLKQAKYLLAKIMVKEIFVSHFK